jgi:chemotaxis protein MotB
VVAVLLSALWLTGCIAVSKDAYQRDMNGMKQQQDWLEAQKRSLDTQLQAEQKKRVEVTESLGQCAKHRDDLQGELKRCKDSRKRIAKSCGRAGRLLLECEENLDRLRTELAHANRKNNLIEARMRAIQRQFDALFQSIRRLKERLAAMVDSGKLKVREQEGFLIIQLQSDILFDTAKANLKAAAKPVLTELAGILKQFKGRRFQVAGHTDPRGGDEINWKLSTNRALAVVDFLIKRGGMPAKMLSAGGYASYLPLPQSDNSEAGMRQNRRVELMLLPDLSELLELAETPK